MIKTKAFVFTTILMLILTGCGKAEQGDLTVYSFSGENEQFAISNGVIVLNDTEEIFAGGDLKVASELFTDITSYTTTFYTISGNEKDVILSNSVTDMTGNAVHVSGDLGQGSGDGIISRTGASNLKDNLYFELIATDKAGEESVYQLQMSLTEITKNTKI